MKYIGRLFICLFKRARKSQDEISDKLELLKEDLYEDLREEISAEIAENCTYLKELTTVKEKIVLGVDLSDDEMKKANLIRVS